MAHATIVASPSSLGFLHVEAITLILNWSNGTEITKLWLTGNNALRDKMRAGAVTRFVSVPKSVRHSLVWPSLLSSFWSLRVLHLVPLPFDSEHISFPYSDVDLRSLSSKLVDLAVPLLSPELPVGSYFPHLKHLTIFKPIYTRSDWPNDLPASLLSLSATVSTPDEIVFCANLPQTLTDLRLHFISGNCQHRLLRLPSNLEHVMLTCAPNDAPLLMGLPVRLRSLRIDGLKPDLEARWSIIPSSLQAIHFSSLPLIQIGHIASLPAGLTSLDLGFNTALFSQALVAALPQSLLILAGEMSMIETSALAILPKTLTVLKVTPNSNKPSLVGINALPPLLRTLKLLSIESHLVPSLPHTLTQLTANLHFSNLETDMDVDEIDDGQLNTETSDASQFASTSGVVIGATRQTSNTTPLTCPSMLASWYGMHYPSYWAQTPVFPSTLTELREVQVPSVSSLTAFPPCLQYLDISIINPSGLYSSEMLAWTSNLPSTLEHMSIEAAGDVLNTDFARGLPNSLTILQLIFSSSFNESDSCFHYHTFNFLPRLLHMSIDLKYPHPKCPVLQHVLALPVLHSFSLTIPFLQSLSIPIISLQMPPRLTAIRLPNLIGPDATAINRMLENWRERGLQLAFGRDKFH